MNSTSNPVSYAVSFVDGNIRIPKNKKNAVKHELVAHVGTVKEVKFFTLLICHTTLQSTSEMVFSSQSYFAFLVS